MNNIEIADKIFEKYKNKIIGISRKDIFVSTQTMKSEINFFQVFIQNCCNIYVGNDYLRFIYEKVSIDKRWTYVNMKICFGYEVVLLIENEMTKKDDIDRYANDMEKCFGLNKHELFKFINHIFKKLGSFEKIIDENIEDD